MPKKVSSANMLAKVGELAFIVVVIVVVCCINKYGIS